MQQACTSWRYLLPADPRTRHHHSFEFKHILSHTAQYKHSFFVRTVPERNSLPEACVNADTVTAFQTQLRHTPWAVCTPPIIVIRESGLTIIELELELDERLRKYGTEPWGIHSGYRTHTLNEWRHSRNFLPEVEDIFVWSRRQHLGTVVFRHCV